MSRPPYLTGVLASSGAVAFGIISLLPVELILQVGSLQSCLYGLWDWKIHPLPSATAYA